ncbi:DUF397 domain-containing protein [Actinomadura sp. LOL_011]
MWRRSSYSSSGENCVEVADVRDHVGVRDSKDPGGGVLVLGADGWRALLHAVKGGVFDR